jgi:hypothetical protein
MRKGRTIIAVSLAAAILTVIFVYLAQPDTVVTYNENMVWENGELDIALHNKTNRALKVSVATDYFTTMALDVEPNGDLKTFPIENLFIEEVSDVFVVCDGYGDEKIYTAKVTVPYVNEVDND